MRVKFVKPYFAATDPHKRGDGRAIQGTLYVAGVHENVPNDLKLPPSATVLDKKPAQEIPIPQPHALHKESGSRPEDNDLEKVQKEAELQRDKNGKVIRGRGRPKKYA